MPGKKMFRTNPTINSAHDRLVTNVWCLQCTNGAMYTTVLTAYREQTCYCGVEGGEENRLNFSWLKTKGPHSKDTFFF